MQINQNLGVEYLIFENISLGCLVAIAKEDQKKIKKFWKQYKGKPAIPEDIINGYSLVQDDEQGSLKIDFSEERAYLIRDLVKFG